MAREPTDMVQLKLRFKESLRERLEQAAQEDGQSLNSAIVARLEQSLREDQEFGVGLQAEVIRAIVGIMGATSRTFGRPWYEDPDGWENVRGTVSYLFTLVEPKEDPVRPPELEMSPRIRAALNEYKARYAEVEKAHRDGVARFTELHMKREREALTEDEQKEFDEFDVKKLPEFPEPDLSADELVIWREQRALTDRIEKARNSSVAYTQPFYRRLFEG